MWPSYASLYLREWEQSFLSEDDLSIYTCHILTWYRYVDNIFMIWEGPEELLKKCWELMNVNNFNLFFTMTFDRKTICYLDTHVKRGPNEQLYMSLYRKEPAGNTILHAQIFQLYVLKNLLPIANFLRTSQTFRLRRTS